MTRCKQFYDKIERLKREIPEVEKWCKKDYDTALHIVLHMNFVEEHLPTIDGISEGATRPLRSLKKTQPELLECVIEEVYKLERPTAKAVNRIIQEKKRESMPVVASREEIQLGSIEDLLDYVQPASVDLILTDPPYPKEYLPLWSVLFEKALVCLKEGGLLVSYAPHIHLPEIFHRVPDGLDYVWVIAQIHAGSAATYHPSRVKIRWKPILVFVKGALPDIDYYDDILQGAGREKEEHEWQQALGESEELIRRFTHEGDLVVDPFLGSGTVVVAAKKNNRNFFGMDIDRLSINTTLQRLEDPPRHADIETAIRRLFFMPKFSLQNIDNMKDELAPQFSAASVEQAVAELVRRGILERVCIGNYRRIV